MDWLNVSLDDDARLTPSYGALNKHNSTELVVVFVIASLLLGTSMYWLVCSFMWSWLSWLMFCGVAAFFLRTRLTLLLPTPLLKYLRNKSHST